MHENTKNDLQWFAAYLVVGLMWISPVLFILWGWV